MVDNVIAALARLMASNDEAEHNLPINGSVIKEKLGTMQEKDMYADVLTLVQKGIPREEAWSQVWHDMVKQQMHCNYEEGAMDYEEDIIDKIYKLGITDNEGGFYTIHWLLDIYQRLKVNTAQALSTVELG